MAFERLYPIGPRGGPRNEFSTYHPGTLPDGTQVLMKGDGDVTYGLWFTADGWLREVRVRFCDVCRPENPPAVRRRLGAEALFAWQDEIGARPGVIRVRKFSVSRPVCVHIDNRLAWMEASLAGDGMWPLEEWKEDIDDWDQQQQFVLNWDGDEIILDNEGSPAG
jgi:hypothetical protein